MYNFPVIAVIAPVYYRLWSIIILGISVITVPELFSRWVMELAKWNCERQQPDNNSRSIERASKCTKDSIPLHIQSFYSIFCMRQSASSRCQHSRSMEQASGILRNRINCDRPQWRHIGSILGDGHTISWQGLKDYSEFSEFLVICCSCQLPDADINSCKNSKRKIGYDER